MMIVTCSQCEANFKVNPEKIKKSGSRVRCSNCQNVFTIYRPQNLALSSQENTSSPQIFDFSDHYDTSNEKDSDSNSQNNEGKFDLNKFLEELEGSGENNFTKTIEQLEQSVTSPFNDKNLKNAFLNDHDDENIGEFSLFNENIEDEIFDFTSPLDLLDEGAAATKQLTTVFTEENLNSAKQITSDSKAKKDNPTIEDDLGLKHEITQIFSINQDSILDELADFDEQWIEKSESKNQENEIREEIKKDKIKNDSLGLEEKIIENAPFEIAIKSTQKENLSPKVKKGLTPLWLILAFAFIILIGIGIFRNLKKADIKAKNIETQTSTAIKTNKDNLSLNENLNPPLKENDQGNQKILLSNNLHFIRNNSFAGKIFIVTGEATNKYPNSRSFLSIKVTLLDKANNILAERFVYAGNNLSEKDLLNLPINEILAQLSLKAGQKNTNIKIEPEQTIPYMVVFDNFPENLTTFKAEAISSSGDE